MTIQLVAVSEDAEALLVANLLTWQGINFSFVFDRKRALKMAKGVNKPTLIVEKDEKSVTGFFNIVDWLKESGRIHV